jgi:folate-binding protein YgfZ
MARRSPVLHLHQRAEAVLQTYGDDQGGCPVVQTYGPVELEYAALRKGCVLLDMPQRATLEVTGADRVEFLGRMVTQETKKWEPYTSRRSFWLSRTGRIEADMRMTLLPECVRLDMDVHVAAGSLKSLSAYIITEDAAISDRTEELHRLALHGPGAIEVLRGVAEQRGGAGVGAVLETIKPGEAALVGIAGASVLVERADSTGEIGLELTVATAEAERVYTTLVQHGSHPPGPAVLGVAGVTVEGRAAGVGGGSGGGVMMGGHRVAFRPAGWAAWNIARIEAGTPVHLIDFGGQSLPAETGVLNDRVSFTKGCYLGQEIVARMHSLGHPKQKVVGLRCVVRRMKVAAADATMEAPEVEAPVQPVSGSQVFAKPAEGAELGDPIGVVSSATTSPLLGDAPVCLATVKFKHIAEGATVLVEAGGAEGGLIEATMLAELGPLASRPKAG